MKFDAIVDSEEKLNEIALKDKLKILPPESILIVVRGMILSHTFPVAVTQRGVSFNQDIKGIIPDSGFMAKFIFHWFKNNSKKILRSTEESTHGTKRLATDTLYRMQIPKPPLIKQAQIVSVVESFQAKLENISKYLGISVHVCRELKNSYIGATHVQ